MRLTGQDRGSMAVEFVIAAPLLVLLLLFMVGGGRIVAGFGQVDGAARDAARAASIARSPAEAQAGADQAAQTDLARVCSGGLSVSPVAGFAAGSQQVTVTITCNLKLGYLLFPTVKATGTAVAPLDQFVARAY
jgi:Flp pilus assembly protein TadG